MTKEIEKPVEPTEKPEQPLVVKSEADLPAVDNNIVGKELKNDPDIKDLQTLREQPTDVAKIEPLTQDLTNIFNKNGEGDPTQADIDEIRGAFDKGDVEEEERLLKPKTPKK